MHIAGLLRLWSAFLLTKNNFNMRNLILIFTLFIVPALCLAQQANQPKINYAIMTTKSSEIGRLIYCSVEFGNESDSAAFRDMRPKEENGRPKVFEKVTDALDLLSVINYECFAAFPDGVKIVYLCRRKVE